MSPVDLSAGASRSSERSWSGLVLAAPQGAARGSACTAGRRGGEDVIEADVQYLRKKLGADAIRTIGAAGDADRRA